MTSEARQAFVEWVLLAPFVDEHLSLTEDEVLQKALQAVGWSEQDSGGMCLSSAYAVARDAAACEEKTEEFLQSRSRVLRDADAAAMAFEWLARILASDGLTYGEKRFLERSRRLLVD